MADNEINQEQMIDLILPGKMALEALARAKQDLLARQEAERRAAEADLRAAEERRRVAEAEARMQELLAQLAALRPGGDDTPGNPAANE